MRLWTLQAVIIGLIALACVAVVYAPQSKTMNDKIRQICSKPSADQIDAEACGRWLAAHQ